MRYIASSTGKQFHASDALLRGIMGPIGSGKSVTCVNEVLRQAIDIQQPGPDGVRRSRWAIVRNTYPELRATTIKTWQDWVPDEICPIVFGAPITGRLQVDLKDGTAVDLEVLFLALDKPKDVKKLLSLELTGIWFNEAREIPKSLIDAGLGRIGRYPSKKDGGWTRKCAIADTNPPDDEHWWYRYAEGALKEGETPAANWAFFQQPPALQLVGGQWVPHPLAENAEHHTDGFRYWLDQVSGKSREWIKVYIEGKYGTVQDGLPVYPDYNDELHCVRGRIKPLPNVPLILGFDFGLTPALIVAQLTPAGRLLFLAEMCAERSGLEQFLINTVKPGLASMFSGLRIGVVVGDPAGNQASQADEVSCFAILRKHGFMVKAAASNGLERRTGAVTHFLTTMIGGRPACALGTNLVTLRKGFNGGYKHERIAVGGEERYKLEPKKNRYSHPHDAAQYVAMEALGDEFYHTKQPARAQRMAPVAQSVLTAGY